MTSDKEPDQVQELLATPDLASVLESRQFRRFLDKIPIAIAVAELNSPERIVYANPDFERLTAVDRSGNRGAAVERSEVGQAKIRNSTSARPSSGQGDFVGTFRIER